MATTGALPARLRASPWTRRARRVAEHVEAAAFLLPATAVLAVFHFFPIGYAFYVSLLRWNLIDPQRPFVGLDNYRQLVADEKFLAALGNTTYFAVASVGVTVPLALGCALLLNRRLAGISWYRTAFFIPYVTPLAAVAMVWQWLYHPDHFGLLNVLLGKVGLPPQRWLLDPVQAMPAMVAVAVWSSLGRDTVIFLAGLQAIPPEYYEAAQIDGASSWQLFRHITLPLLSPTTYFILIISMIGAFKVFALPLFLTGGGPLNRTLTVVYSIYQQGFQYFRMGYAAAQAYTLFLIILLLTLLQRRILSGRVHYEL
ncbi:MAG: sugar ABC transporter permease [Armatimonadota bacterium]|nr:sugar ABC transporter permease [Armatimonadota bacterium]MDR7403435.1 sugar ABC transporter permease [Armatimonadota bacterium]MDR7560726.1 sugar ABC transporter permease [Armatimonadota bacterium]MDR7612756.1 sugar ABC transporter permease [Armatimonadota bacterium]